ncbi:MAG: hypothetical protein DME75_11470 [Verrucomicrobia bacterium]|nr:MAG: hypothetical protein DME75_11470 [Verrucomicrobiota bacterium]
MKSVIYSLALGASFILPVRADLTIVYASTVRPASQTPKEEAADAAGAGTNMTIKIKGDRARIDASPQVTTIFDGKTGEVITLLNDQKTIVRISSDKMKAVTDMLNKFSSKKAAPEKSKLTPTGQKETVNGYETEQYTYDAPDFKAIYWIAPNYPNGAAILAQLQSIKSEFWDAANTRMPDFRDFPGLPIRTRMIIGKEDQADKSSPSAADHATEITSTITSVNQDPISDSEFTVPGGFKETKLPDIFNKKNAAPFVSPNP